MRRVGVSVVTCSDFAVTIHGEDVSGCVSLVLFAMSRRILTAQDLLRAGLDLPSKVHGRFLPFGFV